MSHQTFADAFSPCEEAYKKQVMRNVWGHLAPERNKGYSGHMIFTRSEYGDLTPIKTQFKGLPDSPWFFESMMNFIAEQKPKPGCIYKFTGRFENYEFIGKVTRMKLV